jgi:glycosyltransferase involved in cell wall biosynthesis
MKPTKVNFMIKKNFKTKVAVLSLSSLDNDSRIKKTINTINKRLGCFVQSFSVNSLVEGEGVSISHKKHRLFGVPGLSLIRLYYLYMRRLLEDKTKFNVVVCNDLNTLPIGVFYKKINRRGDVKVIYDAHEYETEVNGLIGIKKQLARLLERFFIKHADEVITVSDSIANEYRRLYSIKKPHLILNCPLYSNVSKQNHFRETLGISTDQKIFLYQGGLSTGRGVELFIEAFSQIDNEQAVLVCMGYGPLEAMVKIKAKQCERVFFHPAVSPEVLLNYTSSADYGICFIEDTCLSYRYCLPNKMFEYLMAGLPVLASNLFEMRRLVEAENVGIIAQENTIKGFKEAVNSLLDKDYEKIKENIFFARKKYCWEEQEKILRKIYSCG